MSAFHSHTFSIPCESWGSATLEIVRRQPQETRFQYSLRIVWFCDLTSETRAFVTLEYFQYSLRIVGFCDNGFSECLLPESYLSVFPANRGVLRQTERV